MNINAILITLLSGISFLVGYLITKFIKNEKKLIIFSVGFAFTTIFGLVFFDLLPECLELIKNKWLILVSALLGIFLLKLLDYFIPDHDHDSNKKDHMEHIGLISTLALILHNIIEGTAIYTTALTNLHLGLIMSLGVSFHNIPLGLQISSLVKNKKEKIILFTSLVMSSVVGVLLIKLFNIILNNTIMGVLIAITLGMLIYIFLFELSCEIKEHYKKNELKLGMLVGVIVIILSHIAH